MGETPGENEMETLSEMRNAECGNGGIEEGGSVSLNTLTPFFFFCTPLNVTEC